MKKKLADTKKEPTDAKRNLTDTKKNVTDTKENVTDTKKNVIDTKKNVTGTKKAPTETTKNPTETTKKLTDTRRPLACAIPLEPWLRFGQRERSPAVRVLPRQRVADVAGHGGPLSHATVRQYVAPKGAPLPCHARWAHHPRLTALDRGMAGARPLRRRDTTAA